MVMCVRLHLYEFASVVAQTIYLIDQPHSLHLVHKENGAVAVVKDEWMAFRVGHL